MRVTRVMKGNENGVTMKKEKPRKFICIKRPVRNRDSNGKLIHRARSSYFSALGVVMNIKPARVNPTTTTTTTTWTSATRSEFRRVRRPVTVCNERVFSAERNTNCALTPHPARRPDPRRLPRPLSARADIFAGAGFGIHSPPSSRNERLLQRDERVRRHITGPFPSRRYPVPLDHPFRRCILPRASVACARGTFSRRDKRAARKRAGRSSPAAPAS